MPTQGTYCPYEVVPLSERLRGEQFTVSTAYGLVQCLRTGPTDSPRATVFVHGVHDDMDTWGPLVHAASQQQADLGSSLFVDLPGFGRSENQCGRLDLVEIGDALMQIVKDVGLQRVRLVGHSMGTLVVADMAQRYPSDVESLHLVAGPYYSIVDILNRRWSGGLGGALAAGTFASQYLLALTGGAGVSILRKAARTKLIRALMWPFIAKPFALRQSVIDHLVADMRPTAFRAAARNAFDYRDGMSWRTIQCPVWAVYGAADRLVPTADSRRLQADLPSAKVTTIGDAAHLAHIEQPDATLDTLGLI